MTENLLNDFFVDAQSHIELCDEYLLKLEENPKKQNLIDTVFRSVHSIKGNAGMLGLKDLVLVGEKLETFLDAVRERGSATTTEVDYMFSSLDDLKVALEKSREEMGFGDTRTESKKEKEPEHDIKNEPSLKETSQPTGADSPANGSQSLLVENNKGNGTGADLQDETVTFLTFMLAEERYGIDIMSIREIILQVNITPVPKSKKFVEGIMNLRDQVIPVFDLKCRLGMQSIDPAVKEKNIIVVEISKVTTGLKVDEVTGIVNMSKGEITFPDTLDKGIRTDFLYGLGKSDGKTFVLLDVQDLCNPDDLLY